MHSPRRLLPMSLVGIVLGLAVTGCGIGQAVEAPINAIGATDVAVQTNLQSAATEAQTAYATSGAYTGVAAAGASGGLRFTEAPSTGPAVVSYASPPGGKAIVLTAYNRATGNCLGILTIGAQLTMPVLGVASPGNYDFTAPRVAASACSAASMAAAPSPPAGWPAGDPSSAGWPKV